MNEQRLINANTLVGPDGLFATRGCAGNCGCCGLWSEKGCRVILEAPTVDAVPVVHGRWEAVKDGWGRCSNCHRMDEIHKYAANCRFCGAKMRRQ